MNTNIKRVWKIMNIKKSNRTIIEQAELEDWTYRWFVLPIRIAIFPIRLIVKLYKWTYNV